MTLPCPHCGTLMTLRSFPNPDHVATDRSDGTLICMCGSRFELQLVTVQAGDPAKIAERRKRNQLQAETYDEHGNRKAVERKA